MAMKDTYGGVDRGSNTTAAGGYAGGSGGQASTGAGALAAGATNYGRTQYGGIAATNYNSGPAISRGDTYGSAGMGGWVGGMIGPSASDLSRAIAAARARQAAAGSSGLPAGGAPSVSMPQPLPPAYNWPGWDVNIPYPGMISNPVLGALLGPRNTTVAAPTSSSGYGGYGSPAQGGGYAGGGGGGGGGNGW
jgi:hypothetical protein